MNKLGSSETTKQGTFFQKEGVRAQVTTNIMEDTTSTTERNQKMTLKVRTKTLK